MAINAISHDSRDEGEGANRRMKKRSVARHAVKPARRGEAGSHSGHSNKVISNSIAYVEGNNSPRPKPFIVHHNLASQTRVVFIVQVLARPVTNISGTRGVTRSGRIFALENLRNKDPTPAKKEKTTKAPKKVVMEEEAHEFLKMICHSEYEMLDQLHKTPARISLLSLLFNSESHRELLLKVLNPDITLEKFGGIINNIIASRHLWFLEEEVSTEGRTHNQHLNIMVKYRGYMIAKVLIDNESLLNVMSKATLDKLYLPDATLKNSPIVVWAFDGPKWEVMGEIILLICIGPKTFDITF
ncbi:hypothetical protein CR513_15419, partial [Mucuna pruriens]